MGAVKPDTSSLPAPLNRENYRCLRVGISDDPEVSVWINSDEDFTFLNPAPVINYDIYQPRVESLGLLDYKKTSETLESRLVKVSPILAKTRSLVEIGAADAAFLALVHDRFPNLDCCAVEPDQNTRPARDALPWLRQFSSLEDFIDSGRQADVISMFHVFEHIKQPDILLDSVRRVLNSEGTLLIEVPSLSDPLLNLYASSTYQEFYFQRQHPYVYSASSLERVLAANNFIVDRVIPYQRYGIENHLQWLTAGKPGGNERFRALFADIADSYRVCMEQGGISDTIFVLAKVAI